MRGASSAISGPKVRDVTKSSKEGRNIGPHLVKVHDETKSSDEGHISDHIWSKSAVRQSPPMRGAFVWLCLVEVQDETKSSDEGHANICRPGTG